MLPCFLTGVLFAQASFGSSSWIIHDIHDGLVVNKTVFTRGRKKKQGGSVGLSALLSCWFLALNAALMCAIKQCALFLPDGDFTPIKNNNAAPQKGAQHLFV